MKRALSLTVIDVSGGSLSLLDGASLIASSFLRDKSLINVPLSLSSLGTIIRNHWERFDKQSDVA